MTGDILRDVRVCELGVDDLAVVKGDGERSVCWRVRSEDLDM